MEAYGLTELHAVAHHELKLVQSLLSAWHIPIIYSVNKVQTLGTEGIPGQDLTRLDCHSYRVVYTGNLQVDSEAPNAHTYAKHESIGLYIPLCRVTKPMEKKNLPSTRKYTVKQWSLEAWS